MSVVLVTVLVGLFFAAGLYFLARGELPKQRQYVTQQITLVPPPPPPPPPPPEEKPVEPEEVIEALQPAEVQQDVEQVSEEPSPEPTPSSELAGLDRPADIGSDSFRLAAGRGGGLFGRGGGGGTWSEFVATHIRRALQRDPRTRTAAGYLEVVLWIEENGHIGRAVLRSSTGNRELDEAIRDVLTSLPPLSRGRPPNVQAETVTGINIRSTEG